MSQRPSRSAPNRSERGAWTSWDDLPLFLTVEQAADVIQVGRSSAYKLTEEWETSHCGLPFVRLGGQKRVPREALRRLAECPGENDSAI